MLKVCMDNEDIHRGKIRPLTSYRGNTSGSRGPQVQIVGSRESTLRMPCLFILPCVSPGISCGLLSEAEHGARQTLGLTSSGDHKPAVFFSQSQPWTGKIGFGLVPEPGPAGMQGDMTRRPGWGMPGEHTPCRAFLVTLLQLDCIGAKASRSGGVFPTASPVVWTLRVKPEALWTRNGCFYHPESPTRKE